MRICALVVIALLGTGFATGEAAAQESSLAGTWELVEQRLVYPDRVVDRSDSLQQTFKILNNTRFSFGRQIRDGEVYAGGGTYTFDGDTYTEHIRYHSEPGLPGQSITFEARVEGDTWHHRGDLGVYVVEEVYRRVER
jgi:hypothetical protein